MEIRRGDGSRGINSEEPDLKSLNGKKQKQNPTSLLGRPTAAW